MGTKLNEFLNAIHEIYDLEQAARLLTWDKEAIMPSAASGSRIQQIATLRSIIHQKLTSPEYTDLLSAAEEEQVAAGYESFEASLLRYCRYIYDRQIKLPNEFIKRSSETSGNARNEWAAAREKNDFQHYAPWLKKIVDLCQEKATLLGYEDEPYDALIEDYERGITTRQIDALFTELSKELVSLREKLDTSSIKIDTEILKGTFSISKQQELVMRLVQEIGYDLSKGYIASSVHPFAMSLTPNDVRITNRWNENYIITAIFGGLHEAGHAMYEQGIEEEFARTPLCGGVSLGIHESQSRFWENIIGRSKGFWNKHFSLLQEFFPEVFKSSTVIDFYRAINSIHPGCIRVEADELTYNLHIILRYEIEHAFLKNEIDVTEAKDIWHEKMKSLIGVVPSSDREGILQDIHWTSPSFGYFPTYTIGNLYAAQFFDTAINQNKDIASECEQGEYTTVRNWLKENIYTYGKKFTPKELLQNITSSELSVTPFVNYITKKLTDIYLSEA